MDSSLKSFYHISITGLEILSDDNYSLELLHHGLTFSFNSWKYSLIEIPWLELFFFIFPYCYGVFALVSSGAAILMSGIISACLSIN